MILFPVSREAFLPFLIFSFFAGILFGAVYDIFRIRRIAFRSSKKAGERVDAVIIFFEDIIFSLFAAVTLILLCYKLYYGVPRWYSFAAAIGGFVLWRKTAGRLVMKLANKIIAAITAIFSFIGRRIMLPPLRLLKNTALKLSGRVKRRCALSYTKFCEKQILASICGREKQKQP